MDGGDFARRPLGPAGRSVSAKMIAAAEMESRTGAPITKIAALLVDLIRLSTPILAQINIGAAVSANGAGQTGLPGTGQPS